jgi:hypothetical protein
MLEDAVLSLFWPVPRYRDTTEDCRFDCSFSDAKTRGNLSIREVLSRKVPYGRFARWKLCDYPIYGPVRFLQTPHIFNRERLRSNDASGVFRSLLGSILFDRCGYLIFVSLKWYR